MMRLARKGLVSLVAAALVPVAASVATATSAHATTPIVVTTTADVVDPGDGVISLREAVAMADAAPGADWILLANGATYDLTICGADDDTTPDNAVGDLDVTGSDWLDITPASSSGPAATIHQTCPQRIIYAPTAGLLLREVNLTGGQGSTGAALRAGGFLTLEHVDQSGAGVGAFPSQDSAAIYSTARPVTIEDSAIHDNTAEGLYQGTPTASADSFVIARSSIRSNATTISTGAGGVWAAGTLTMSDSEVVDNGGPKAGSNYPARVGGMCLSCGNGVFGTSTITATVIARNAGSATGGLSGGFHLVDSAITDNTALVAGGAGGDFEIERSLVARNSADLGAAGLWGTGSITDSTIADNTTPGLGGGIMTGPRPGEQTLTVTNSTITGNHGQVAGGLLVVNDGNGDSSPGSSWPVDVTLTASTVAGNVLVPSTGPGPFSTPNSSDLNFARATADGPAVSAGSLTVSSSVLGSGGSATPACTLLAASSVTSAGHSFSADATCGLGAGAGDVSGGGDPGLSPLADHGGPTPTMAPAPGSPLIDRVPVGFSGCPGSDQRGMARPVGAGCDIGATEAAPQRFHSVSPARILDTRPAPLRVGPLGPWTAGETQDVSVVGGLSGVPDTATAVVLNVTATGGTANDDYLSIWPSGADRPTVSSLDVDAGATVANQVTVMVGSGGAHAGKISVFNAGGTQQVVVDVNGYYDPSVGGDGFTSLSPVRVADSRPAPQRVGSVGRWSAGQTQDVPIGGLGWVPDDADAVVLNVTATGGTASGNYLSIWPAGGTQPTVSSVNVDSGRTVANAVTVKLGTGGAHMGQISIFNAGGTQDVIVDVVGYFEAGSGKAFYPLVPGRLIDSRPPPLRVGPLGPWGDDGLQVVTATGPWPAVPVGADAVVANVTATDGTVNRDYLTIYPPDDGRPNVSSLNVDAGQTVANAVTVRLARVGPPVGGVGVYNAGGTIDVIVDVAGYYA